MLRCGVDLLEIARVEASYARFGERFLRRFFTAGEQADCSGEAHRMAARIAGKEAVAKALGTGIGPVSWTDIEIRSADNGRPILHLHGAAQDVANDLAITEWDISLTHTDALASAFCVAL